MKCGGFAGATAVVAALIGGWPIEVSCRRWGLSRGGRELSVAHFRWAISFDCFRPRPEGPRSASIRLQLREGLPQRPPLVVVGVADPVVVHVTDREAEVL